MTRPYMTRSAADPRGRTFWLTHSPWLGTLADYEEYDAEAGCGANLRGVITITEKSVVGSTGAVYGNLDMILDPRPTHHPLFTALCASV